MLLLAHFLADFPLQTNWMVERKSNFWVLTLHVSIHFVLMFFLVGQSRNEIWPYLLVITLIHWGQDRLKLLLTDLWPQRMVQLFFMDQIFHYAAIWALITWLQAAQLHLGIIQNATWAIIGIAYLVVTYAWYICERVIAHTNVEYLKIVEETKITRMLARGGLVSLFFFVRGWALPNVAILPSWPYPESVYRKRALTTDLTVSFVVIGFLLITLGLG